MQLNHLSIFHNRLCLRLHYHHQLEFFIYMSKLFPTLKKKLIKAVRNMYKKLNLQFYINSAIDGLFFLHISVVLLNNNINYTIIVHQKTTKTGESARRNAPVDSHNRLFGETDRPYATPSKNHFKSSIQAHAAGAL